MQYLYLLTRTSAIFFTSEREIILSRNCNKFAVDFNWNKKNSQNVQTLGLFENIDRFFFLIFLNFFKIATCGKVFLEWFLNGILS